MATCAFIIYVQYYVPLLVLAAILCQLIHTILLFRIFALMAVVLKTDW